MNNFVDNYIYFLTYFSILLGAIIIASFGVQKKLLTYRKQIVICFALVQLILFIIVASIRINKLLWHRLLMTDLCPVIAFISIIIFLIDKEKYYKPFMPWLIVGASFTMLASDANLASDTINMVPSYLQHTTMLTQGIFAYFIVGKYNKKEQLTIFILPFCLLIWILLVAFIPWQVTGDKRWALYSTALLKPSIEPAYIYDNMGHLVDKIYGYAILESFGIPYPIPSFAFYILAIALSFLIVNSKKLLEIINEKIIKPLLQLRNS